MAIECVNVFHHAGWAMQHGKEIGEEFLADSEDGKDLCVAFHHAANGIAIAEQVEVYSPEVLSVFSNRPSDAGGFAEEAVP